MAFNPRDVLIKLKGKDYLEVKWRLYWFNEQYPIESGWKLTTELVQDTGEFAMWRAYLINPDGQTVRTGTKVEHKRQFEDYNEKAETGSIGRCLGMAGFGTQFCEEFEEGDRIVDAPVAFKNNKQEVKQEAKQEVKQPPKSEEKAEDANEKITTGKVKTIEYMITRLNKKGKPFDVAEKLKEFGKESLADLTKTEGEKVLEEINNLLAG